MFCLFILTKTPSQSPGRPGVSWGLWDSLGSVLAHGDGESAGPCPPSLCRAPFHPTTRWALTTWTCQPARSSSAHTPLGPGGCSPHVGGQIQGEALAGPKELCSQVPRAWHRSTCNRQRAGPRTGSDLRAVLFIDVLRWLQSRLLLREVQETYAERERDMLSLGFVSESHAFMLVCSDEAWQIEKMLVSSDNWNGGGFDKHKPLALCPLAFLLQKETWLETELACKMRL